MNEENLPLVHFLYLRESDAIASAKQVRVAVAKAKLIQAGRRLKTGLRTGRARTHRVINEPSGSPPRSYPCSRRARIRSPVPR